MKNFGFSGSMTFPYLLVFGVAILRIEAVHLDNLIPVFSCLLFFGAMRKAREFVLPLFVLVDVDIFLTTHQYGYPVTVDAVVTWAWYLIAMLLGSGLLRTSSSWRRVAGCTLLASVSFFW